jgi:phosphate transport system substrate-binding protein
VSQHPNVLQRLTLGLAAIVAASGASIAAAQVAVDPKLPSYSKSTDGVSGSVKSIGSDTMNNLMTLWQQGFKEVYPNVTIEVEGKGSSTAPPALVAGTASFGPMSRPMKEKELADFEKAYGYKPIGLPAALDMLAVYVHKDNPIHSLTLAQVDAIFSKSRNGGADKDIVTWGDLGLTGEWAKKPIGLYGRNSASGTYGFFKEFALFKGDFKNSVSEQAGSSSVVQAVATDKFAMGYSGIGYITADVRAVPLQREPDDDIVPATPENAYTGLYPLSRYLLVYVNHKPGTQLDPLRREFVRYMFSREGQMVVVKDGYYPVTERTAAAALKSVGLEFAPAAAPSAPAAGGQ